MAIADDIRQIIAKTLDLPLDRLAADTKLEDLGAESLDVIEIVYEIEEKYDLHVAFEGDANSATVKIGPRGGPAREVAFATVGDIVNAVQDAVAARAP